jgi:hypothetical protein
LSGFFFWPDSPLIVARKKKCRDIDLLLEENVTPERLKYETKGDWREFYCQNTRDY